MPKTRNKVLVVARVLGTKDRFIQVERRTLGTNPAQEQCCQGLMEFDLEAKRFQNIPKDKRSPFKLENSKPEGLITIRDQK